MFCLKESCLQIFGITYVCAHPNPPCLFYLCYQISMLTKWSHMLTKTLEMLTRSGLMLTKAYQNIRNAYHMRIHAYQSRSSRNYVMLNICNFTTSPLELKMFFLRISAIFTPLFRKPQLFFPQKKFFLKRHLLLPPSLPSQFSLFLALEFYHLSS